MDRLERVTMERRGRESVCVCVCVYWEGGRLSICGEPVCFCHASNWRNEGYSG